VQLYVSRPGMAGAPIRALAGFQRIHFARGEKRQVSFTLGDRDLSIVDPEGVRRIVPGEVNVWLGGGQPGGRDGLIEPPGVSARFEIGQEMTFSEATN
jgi:beta-glucosidase